MNLTDQNKNTENISKRILILGSGESGIGAALLAKYKGYEVFVSDAGTISPKNQQVLTSHQITFESEGHSEKIYKPAVWAIKSPGIPDSIPIIKKLKELGIQIISEIEFAFLHQSKIATLVAITGSNGKTTTTSLMGHIMREANLDTGVSGNIGYSFARSLYDKKEHPHSHYALELSSFQLDGTKNFKPNIAILTSLSEDHLDRYDYDFKKYIHSKFRIVASQTSKDFFIYDADNPVIEAYVKAHEIAAQCYPFSLERKLKQGVFLDKKQITFKDNDTSETLMDYNFLALKGKHNIKNAMAAAMASKLLGIRKQVIKDSLSSFEGVAHRMEEVKTIKKVHYINDSKATNINATYYALEAVKTPIIWIVGGVDKGNNYNELLELVTSKVKAIICLGIDNTPIKEVFSGGIIDLYETDSMQDAVACATKISEANDTVLLSPCCASFDLFKNYEDRGDQFKACVNKL